MDKTLYDVLPAGLQKYIQDWNGIDDAAKQPLVKNKDMLVKTVYNSHFSRQDTVTQMGSVMMPSSSQYSWIHLKNGTAVVLTHIGREVKPIFHKFYKYQLSFPLVDLVNIERVRMIAYTKKYYPNEKCCWLMTRHDAEPYAITFFCNNEQFILEMALRREEIVSTPDFTL